MQSNVEDLDNEQHAALVRVVERARSAEGRQEELLSTWEIVSAYASPMKRVWWAIDGATGYRLFEGVLAPGEPLSPRDVALQLEYASEAEAEITEGLSTNGQGEMMARLSKLPLALAERSQAKGADTSHLGRFEGTELVQWFGRRSDGRFHPIGKVMKIVWQ